MLLQILVSKKKRTVNERTNFVVDFSSKQTKTNFCTYKIILSK